MSMAYKSVMWIKNDEISCSRRKKALGDFFSLSKQLLWIELHNTCVSTR